MAAEPKTTVAGDDDDLLLPGLWREILIRVPVKSILQCRSVCKSWHSLISCPNFIEYYSIRNLNKNGKRVLLQLYDGKTESCSYSSYVESFMECREHPDVPEPFLVGKEVYIVSSCNGLICLSKCCPMKDDVSVITFLIWNPTIRKTVELPPRTYHSRTHEPSFYGFGFDSKTNDYKVLCVVASLGKKSTYVCEVFYLSKGVWRTINPKMHHSWSDGGPTPECYLNGVVHWPRYHTDKSRAKSSDTIILSFDMADELFRVIKMPSGAYMTGLVQTHIVTFNGLIYVILIDGRVDEDDNCSVWTMKEYGITESWTKMFNINRQIARGLPNNGISHDRFRMWSSNEVLMTHGIYEYDDEDVEVECKEDLVLYNTENRKLKYLCSSTKVIYDPCFYDESLVLM